MTTSNEARLKNRVRILERKLMLAEQMLAADHINRNVMLAYFEDSYLAKTHAYDYGIGRRNGRHFFVLRKKTNV